MKEKISVKINEDALSQVYIGDNVIFEVSGLDVKVHKKEDSSLREIGKIENKEGFYTKEELSYNADRLKGVVKDMKGDVLIVEVTPYTMEFDFSANLVEIEESFKEGVEVIKKSLIDEDIPFSNVYITSTTVCGTTLCLSPDGSKPFARVCNMYEGVDNKDKFEIILKGKSEYHILIKKRNMKKLICHAVIEAILNPVPIGKGEEQKIKRTLKSVMDDIKYLSKAELNERVSYMRDIEIDEETIIEILDLYEEENECLRPASLYINSKKKNQSCLIKEMLLDILDGHNVLLEGPKSIGKNVAWETVAWLLNMKLSVLKITNNSTNDDVFGCFVTDNSSMDLLTKEDAKAFVTNSDEDRAADFALNKAKASSTHLVFKEGLLTEMLHKGRGLFIFDEMDMGNANFLSSILNTLCDDHSQVFEIPGYGIVPLSKKIIIGATQNGSEYMGTQPQNVATMSRFSKYNLPNLPNITEILKKENVDVSEDIITKLNQLYIDLYDKVACGEISDTCLNIRGFKRALRNIKRGFSISRAVENQIANICGEDEKMVIMDIII